MKRGKEMFNTLEKLCTIAICFIMLGLNSLICNVFNPLTIAGIELIATITIVIVIFLLAMIE